MTRTADWNNALAAVAPENPVAKPLERPPISHWAELYGLQDEDALVLAAAVLAGLANGMGRLNVRGARVSVEPLVLVTSSDSRALSALGKVTGAIPQIQKLLIQKSRAQSVDRIREAYVDKPTGWRDSPLGILSSESDASSLGWEDAGSKLHRDIITGDRDRAFEKFTRPSIIQGGTLAENLAGRLPMYHLGSMLCAPGVVRLPSDKRKRDERVSELMRCAQGLETDSIPLHRLTPGDQEHVRLCGIVAMPPSDLRWLLERRRDFFEVFVPWLPGPRASCSGDFDLGAALGFERCLTRTAKAVFAARRECFSYQVGVDDHGAANSFWTRTRGFRTACAGLGEERPISVPDRFMPALAWAAGISIEKPDDAWLVSAAYEAARHLAGSALHFYDRADLEALAAGRLRLARKVVARIAKSGPIKRRELVRGFARQSLDLFTPVLDILTSLGVIREDGNLLEIGSIAPGMLEHAHFLPPPRKLPE